MLIAGNLDVEVTWARLDAAARRERGEKAFWPDDPRFALPEPVMWKISAAATLLRVFADSDADQLWTPRHVDPWRMARIDWLAMPRLVTGPVPESVDLWWGASGGVAGRVNHRAFLHELRVASGIALPGEAIVRDLADLESRTAGLASWVAKAPHSAAGRLRVRGEGAHWTEPMRTQARRLLMAYGCVLVEPWIERARDFGIRGTIGETASDNSDAHALLVDAAGRFHGIRLPARGSEVPAEFVPELQRISFAVVRALMDAGYRGPFGADLYVGSVGGVPRLVLSEINARMTFGHVAARLAQRREAALGIDDASVSLRFGRGAPPPDTIPLLLPAPDEDTSAWLEYAARHDS